FLEAACAGDEQLRREVESLLAAHQKAEHFLDTPAVELAANVLVQAQRPSRQPSESKPTLIGTTVSHYRIQDKLGVGGMGEVYRARDSKLNREVALKVLPDALAQSPERMARFQREARALAALNHPNIVTIYDVISENGVDFIAMEFVQG